MKTLDAFLIGSMFLFFIVAICSILNASTNTPIVYSIPTPPQPVVIVVPIMPGQIVVIR